MERRAAAVLSCSTVAFDGYDLDDAFRGIAEAGFVWVEPAFIEGYASNFSEALFSLESAREVRTLLSKHSLQCSGVSGHIDLGGSDGVARMERRIHFCEEVGSPRLITNAADARYEGAFYANMASILAAAANAGVVICLENPGNGVPNLVNDGASAAQVVERLSSPFARINYDGGNTFSHFHERFPAESDFGPAIPWLEQLHLKDVRVGPGGVYEYPALGEGEIDFPGMAQTLRDGSAEGSGGVKVLSLEIPLRMRRNPDASPFRLQEALPYDRIVEALKRSRGLAIECFRDFLR